MVAPIPRPPRARARWARGLVLALLAAALPAGAREPVESTALTCAEYLSLDEKTRRGIAGSFLWAYLTSRSASDLNPQQAGVAIASIRSIRETLDSACRDRKAGDKALENAAAVIEIAVAELRKRSRP